MTRTKSLWFIGQPDTLNILIFNVFHISRFTVHIRVGGYSAHDGYDILQVKTLLMTGLVKIISFFFGHPIMKNLRLHRSRKLRHFKSYSCTRLISNKSSNAWRVKFNTFSIKNSADP